MINSIKHWFEKHGFEVLTRMANTLGIPVGKLRVFFIYANFFTVGALFLVYLFLAFVLWLKDVFFIKRPSVWDL
jgi:type IV secretory pathway VirB3-like protein